MRSEDQKERKEESTDRMVEVKEDKRERRTVMRSEDQKERKEESTKRATELKED